MSKRLLLVHAHPDDECITTGATMAKYAADGAQVTLVTCTLGEEGEVLIADLAHLAAAHQDGLGVHRETELRDSMAILGVDDYRLLGGPGRFRDSGMMGEPSNDREGCFWRADLLEAAVELVKVIREVRPQVVVTYDEFGGYGHPDHIQAHRVAHYAVALAENATFRPELGEPWIVQKVYWTAFPRSVVRAGIESIKARGVENEFTQMDLDSAPMFCDDAFVTTAIEAQEYVPRKFAALRAHRTQVSDTDGFLGIAEAIGNDAFGTEYFRLARGVACPAPGSDRETDLFAGIPE